MTISLSLIDELPTVPPLVTLKKLCVVRGQKQVLRGITTEVRRGEITAIIGLNGSGKSTFLRSLLNEFDYSGTITYHCGHDHRQPKPEHIGYVPQRLMIDPRLPCTVRDVMGMALQRRPIFFSIRRALTKKMEALLERVGVPGVLDTPIDGLSGGQLQRVLLALALEPAPELLLLDEPASGIDFQSLSAFYQLIRELNHSTGITVLLVSHDLGMLPGFAHRVFCLKDGVIADSGPPEFVLTAQNLAQLYGPGLQRLSTQDTSEAHVHTASCLH